MVYWMAKRGVRLIGAVMWYLSPRVFTSKGNYHMTWIKTVVCFKNRRHYLGENVKYIR